MTFTRTLRNTARIAPGFCALALLLTGQHGAAQVTAEPKPASPATVALANEITRTLPFDDRQDFDFATRGFIAPPLESIVRDADGNIVRDYSQWAMFAGEAPDTVNPSLWRVSQLLSQTGLFKVADGVYQIRGMDIANMSVIIGKSGYIIVDPMMNVETTAAAMRLVRQTLGDRPVSAVLITHSHLDHYGGIGAVVSDDDSRSGKVPVIAPAGFAEAVTRENIIAGPAMLRRAAYAFGTALPMRTDAMVSSGLGPAYPQGIGPGTVSYVAPNREIAKAIESITVDGVEMEFMLTPDTEAPAEYVFYLPAAKALCTSEVATGTLHNVLTLRGAVVRDAKAWADDLTAIEARYGELAEVAFASHYWPRFGNGEVRSYLVDHRDMYKFMHDQTVRLMNNGLVKEEIAEALTLPENLARRWYNREYYGTLSHDAKAIYQRYLGWYDANPANLNPLPPVALAQKYVEAIGGADKVVALGRDAMATGDYRWAVELLNRAVFARPDNGVARLLLADSYEQLGYQAESAMWRSAYLSAAADLRKTRHSGFTSGGVNGKLPVADLLDLAAVRLDPAKLGKGAFTIGFREEGNGRRHLIDVHHGVLVHTVSDKPAMVEVTGGSQALAALIAGKDVAAIVKDRLLVIDAGDDAGLSALQAALPAPDGNFAIAEP